MRWLLRASQAGRPWVDGVDGRLGDGNRPKWDGRMSFSPTETETHHEDASMKAPAGHRLALLFLGVLLVGASMAMPAMARRASHGSGGIAFYGDIGNIIGSHNPLLVRPSTLLLAEDGSVALVHLEWRGWGSNVARATGTWSASNCIQSCAAGQRSTSKIQLILSDPGVVDGHRVYRCFNVKPSHPKRDFIDHGCIRLQGAVYAYSVM